MGAPLNKLILVASDLSDGARVAYPHAAGLAKALKGVVTMLHVDEVPARLRGASGALADYVGALHAAREAKVAEHAEDFTRLGVDFEVELASGAAKHVIAERANLHEAGIVIIARHGEKRTNHLFGSTVTGVLRLSDVPVLVVPAEDERYGRMPRKYRRILAPTDLSGHAVAVLQATLDLAAYFAAHVELLHVTELPAHIPTAGFSPGLPRTSLEPIIELARADLDSLARRAGPGNLDGTVVLGEDAAEAIRKKAADGGADLIIMAASGKGAVSRLVLGSTAEEIAKTASVPVLILPQAYIEKYEDNHWA